MPLTLECDDLSLTYVVGESGVVFRVGYGLRVNDRHGVETWSASCKYAVAYSFTGAEPTQDDANRLAVEVKKLGADHLRELMQWLTGLAAMTPLLIDITKPPSTLGVAA